MAANVTPTLFLLESQPDWGRAALLDDREGKLTLLFEHGGRRVFAKAQVKGLKQAELAADEARTVDARLRGRPMPQRNSAKKLSKSKSAALRAPTAAFASFEAQVAWFEKIFPGGFAGEKYISEERGAADAKGKKGHKTAAIALAQAQLSPEQLASATPEETFEVAKKLLSFTNLVFPMEGPLLFKSMKEEDRPGFVAALGALLHGEGAYGPRFERFTDSLRFWDDKGQAKKVTWPLATLLQAFYAPEQHSFVKPTIFEKQALVLNLKPDKQQLVNSTGYAAFLDVARKTSERLVSAGYAPRDLMDVYSFIWRSHAELPAAATTAAPV
jgi:hypothetical protein